LVQVNVLIPTYVNRQLPRFLVFVLNSYACRITRFYAESRLDAESHSRANLLVTSFVVSQMKTLMSVVQRRHLASGRRYVELARRIQNIE